MLPLEGKRILVARTRQQASELACQLEDLGATAISIPSIEIVPPASYAVLDESLGKLNTFDWLVFTSANAVEVFAKRHVAGLMPKRVAAIGPATAKALEGIGLNVDLIPPRYVAESLADAMVQQVNGSQVLLVRAEEARDVLPDALQSAGAVVTIAPSYRNQVPIESIPAIREVFSSRALYPDAVMLTSASTVRNLLALIDAAGVSLPTPMVFASIGPITSAALREHGYEPALEAREATIPALVQALAAYFK